MVKNLERFIKTSTKKTCSSSVGHFKQSVLIFQKFFGKTHFPWTRFRSLLQCMLACCMTFYYINPLENPRILACIYNAALGYRDSSYYTYRCLFMYECHNTTVSSWLLGIPADFLFQFLSAVTSLACRHHIGAAVKDIYVRAVSYSYTNSVSPTSKGSHNYWSATSIEFLKLLCMHMLMK